MVKKYKQIKILYNGSDETSALKEKKVLKKRVDRSVIVY